MLAALAIFVVGCSSSGESVPPPGDPSGLTTGSGEQLVGLAPGTITQDNYDKAKVAEPFATKLADLVDQNRLGTNFVWLLVTGFLVMFMQAGFALVETGFTRAKNAMHTMSMNFMVYGIGIVGYFLVGFGFAFGGARDHRRDATSADRAARATMLRDHHRRHDLGPPRHDRVRAVRVALRRRRHRVLPVPARVHGHRRHHPDRLDGRALALEAVRPLRPLRFGDPVPVLRNWTWGGGWLSPARAKSALASATRTSPDPASSTRIGGWCALAGAMVIGPRIGTYVKTARHCRCRATTRSWRSSARSSLPSAGSASTRDRRFGASGNGALRIGIVAVVTLLASGFGAARRCSTPCGPRASRTRA